MPVKGYRKPDSRTSYIRVRLTENEQKMLEKISKRFNLTYSDFVRKRIEVFYNQYFKDLQ